MKRTLRKSLALFACVAAAPIASPFAAPKASSAAAPAPKVTYDDQILPILRNRCLSCHNPDQHKAGLDLSTYSAAMAGNEDGVVITPGKLDDSLILKVVNHTETPYMPPKADKLSDADLKLMHDWVLGGALENSGSKVVIAKPQSNIAIATPNYGKLSGPSPMPPLLPIDPIVHSLRPGPLESLASSPGAPLVAVGGQQQILLYNSQSLLLLGVLPYPEGVAHVLKFSRNGKLLIAGGGQAGKSGKVVVWDVATAKRIIVVGDEYDAVMAADISPDQAYIALGGPSKSVKIFSTRDGSLVRTIKKHTDWVNSIAYSPDGVLLASGDRAGGLMVWEARTGEEFLNLTGHKAGITDLAFRGDSNVLASASQDGTIKLWSMNDGSVTNTIGADPGGVLSVAFASDGRLVSCGRDNTVHLWEANGGAGRRFDPFSDIALHAVFDHDAARVIAGDFTGEIRVLNCADGARIGLLSADPPGRADVATSLQAARDDMAKKLKEMQSASAAAKTSETAAAVAEAQLAAARKTLAEAKALAASKHPIPNNAAKPATAPAIPVVDIKQLAQQVDVLQARSAQASADAAKQKAAADLVNKDAAAAKSRAESLAALFDRFNHAQPSPSASH